MTSPVAAHGDSAPKRALRRRRALPALVLALVATEALLYFHIFERAAPSLTHIRLGWISVALAAELLSVAALGLAQRRMLAAGGERMTRRQICRLALAANALNVTMPAGNAVSSAYMLNRFRARGIGVPVAGFAVLSATGLTLIAFIALSVLLTTSQGGALVSSIGTAAAVFALLVAALLIARIHRRDPRRLAELTHRVWGGAARASRRDPAPGRVVIDSFFRDVSLVHPRGRDWAASLMFSSGYWLADLACLVACGRALPPEVLDIRTMAGAYLAGMTIAGLSLVPGGLGTVETTMILALTPSAGTNNATGVVLLYRLISFVLIGGIGWAIWLGERRTSPRAHRRLSRSAYRATRGGVKHRVSR